MRFSTLLLTSLSLVLGIAYGKNEDREDRKTPPMGPSHPLVEAARCQIGLTTRYDGSYVLLDYPGGDVDPERGVCTDVIIRAMRQGYTMDLQKLVHMDMKANFAKYPKSWGLKGTDRNIDHRRVPNLETFFKRKGYSLQLTHKAENFQAGDLVTCTVPPHLPHIMIVSNRKNSMGVPLVIHNIGRGAQEQDCLFTYKLTGHYRIPVPQAQ